MLQQQKRKNIYLDVKEGKGKLCEKGKEEI